MKKAIFLDRDGVINEDILNYTWRVSDFRILPGVIDACKKFLEKGYRLIVITNQGGIAKGLYTHEEVDILHSHMAGEFKKHGITFDEIYYCPHHNETGKCLCRKPGSLLVEKAIARFNIDPSASYFIGDRERDTQSGDSAGVKGILVDVNSDLTNTLKFIA